jgi:hypothetical protein
MPSDAEVHWCENTTVATGSGLISVKDRPSLFVTTHLMSKEATYSSGFQRFFSQGKSGWSWQLFSILCSTFCLVDI